jgi:hypothetical protein
VIIIQSFVDGHHHGYQGDSEECSQQPEGKTASGDTEQYC